MLKLAGHFAACFVAFACGVPPPADGTVPVDPNQATVSTGDISWYASVRDVVAQSAGEPVPSIVLQISNTPLCGKPTPTQPFWLATFSLEARRNQTLAQPYPGPGSYQVVSKTPHDRPDGNYAVAVFQSYGDPTKCGYATCNQEASLGMASGTLMVESVDFDALHPTLSQITASFSGLDFQPELGEHGVYTGPKNGHISSSSVCASALQPPEPFPAGGTASTN